MQLHKPAELHFRLAAVSLEATSIRVRIGSIPEVSLLRLTFALFASAILSFPQTSLPSPAQTPAKPLTVEAIYGHGPLVGTPPSGLTWSPDGKHLTYLDSGELVDIDPASGKSQVLVSRAKLAALSGASATETDRDHRDRYKMANYLWAPDSAHLCSTPTDACGSTT